MKFTILLHILFDLLAKRKLTAKYLSEKYEISPRSVYRYVDILSLSVPLYIQRGRNGGIFIADTYTLPVGFMSESEYESAIDALTLAYAQTQEERFLTAKRKLSAKEKTETKERVISGSAEHIFIDGNGWCFFEKIQAIQESIQEKKLLEMEYLSPFGEKTRVRVEPHALALRKDSWLLYAFCHTRRAFHFFSLGRVLSLRKSAESFRFRPFSPNDLRPSEERRPERIFVRLAFYGASLIQAQEWLGAENLQKTQEGWQAEAYLPNDETLLKKLLSFGAEVRVIQPIALRERLLQTAQTILSAYTRNARLAPTPLSESARQEKTEIPVQKQAK